jgi:superfamily II DNA or RNA helicase
MTVIARLDRRISIRKVDLPDGVIDDVKALLTVVNQDVQRARERGDWGAEDVDLLIRLYDEDRVYLYLPRGFATMLRAGLAAKDVDLRWDDQTVTPAIPLRVQLGMRYPTLSPEQEESVQQLLTHRQGVLESPTGSGKTVVVLEAWRRTGLKGLILVEKSHLAEQWRERALEHLGIETGLIGDGVWEERDLTVAMLQTLRRRRTPLAMDGFFRRWGFVAADECHHMPAFTYRGVVELFWARFLPGVTATALDGDWRQPILRAVLGEVFHIASSDRIVKPEVRLVRTDFLWEPQTKAEQALTDSRAIYRHIIAKLQGDMERLHLIADTIMAQPERSCQLVACPRKGYLSSIREVLLQHGYDPESVFYMRGDESREERQHVAHIAAEGSCVILATVADEGVDIPRLDRLHMVWPARKALGIIQKVGRLARDHPDKEPPVVLDYLDHRQGVMRSQFKERVATVYDKLGLKVALEER